MTRLATLAAVSLTFVLADQQVNFRSSTTRVVVDVVVTDSNGEPVPNLTVGDFALRDRGHLQRILDFQYVSIASGSREIDLRAEPAPPVDVADNARPAPSGRAFVFVIDDGTLGGPSIPKIKTAMAEFLGAMSPDDRAAVVFIRRSDYAEDFTNDTARLIAAVNRTTWAVGWEADYRASFWVLRNALRILQSAPQLRKALIYISAGFSISFSPETRDALLSPRPTLELMADRDAAGELAALVVEARRAGIALYTLSPEFGVGIRRNDVKGDFLRLLSSVTGGLAYIRPSDLSKAARAIIADNNSYYLLGFDPEPDDPDGEFHRVEVTMAGRSDLRVRARQGYHAMPPVLATSPAEHVRLALASAHPGGDLQLRGFAVPVALTERGARVAVTIEASYPGGMAATYDDSLHLALLALSPDGQVVGSAQQLLKVRLAGHGSVPINHVLALPGGKGSIRASLFSDRTGKSGVVHIPIDVPGARDRAPILAPLVVGVGRDGSEVLQPEPLRPFIPFQPTTRRTFATSEELLVLTRVLRPAPGATRRLVLRQDQRVVRAFEAEERSGGPDGLYRVSLVGLARGPYILEFLLATAKTTFPSAIRIDVH